MWQKKKKHLKEPNSKMRNSNTIKGKKREITEQKRQIDCHV